MDEANPLPVVRQQKGVCLMNPSTELKLSEKDITAQIKGYMEAEGWTPVRLQSGMLRGMNGNTGPIRLQPKGTPDWLFVRRQVAVWVEIKAPKKELSSDQVAWFIEAQRKKHLTIWANGLGVFITKYTELFSQGTFTKGLN